MHASRPGLSFFVVLTVMVLSATSFAGADPAGNPPPQSAPGGELVFAGPDGATLSCPLRHTTVKGEITGHVARVEVTQSFGNVSERAIEAVYLFPLPNHAAVDDMEIQVGNLSVIRGVVKKKEEARDLYVAARKAGKVSALLDQERPNVFKQSVANIPPGVEVTVRIRYVETLPYLEGQYEFTFPMVVAPRHAGIDPGNGALADSDEPVEAILDPGDPDDADPLDDPDGADDSAEADEEVGSEAPPNPDSLEAVAAVRSGHDISLEIHLDAAAPVRDLTSPTHQVEMESDGRGGDEIRLSRLDSMPNRDFVLRYSLDDAAPQLVVLTHRGEKGGSFMALVQPGLDTRPDAVVPKELIFVVDDSGSMSGAPIEQVRKAMLHALRNLGPRDTFQILAFADRVRSFSDTPVLATAENVERAAGFVEKLSGDGGTILIDGVRKALSYPENPDRVRIISFMTDGLIGNEVEILAYIEQHLGKARLFPMGVGAAPNRYLLDSMADFGRGAVEYVQPADESTVAVDRFYERIRTPILTDLAIDWAGLSVSDVTPTRIPDLFAGQPVVLHGRYDREGSANVRLTGRLAGRPFERTLHVVFPPRHDDGEAIETLWARARIADLSRDNGGHPGPDQVEQIVRMGIDYRLVTDYTSFVAVEERVTAGGGEPMRVNVPSFCPAGMSCEARAADLLEACRVTGVTDVVDTESTTISTTIRADFIDALPILGRSYQSVLTLAPGVSDGDGDGNPNVHGARDTDVNTLVDGASEVGTSTIGRQLDITTIQDIDVVTSGASAEFGRAQGGFERIDPPLKAAAGHVSVGIDLPRRAYRLGETIEVTVTIENHGSRLVILPETLSVALGTARFAIEGTRGARPAEPALSTFAGKTRSIAPGERLVFRVLINGPGGYGLDTAGRYTLRFLGAPFGLADSNPLELILRP